MTTEPPTQQHSETTEPKKASLLQTAWIVMSGLVMIGRSRDFGPSAPRLDPVVLVVVAIVGALFLIAALVTLAVFVAH